ncbi:unnamed protein product [Hymenolepis diminuta]|uniref:Integrase catalytic domain-containing protein n=1 Tax=Hymenolepis diminuta TaxID=6216 RepID=A0A564YC28_HYMDI|nr:unnamed protein product [Hymenolepis diminuta]
MFQEVYEDPLFPNPSNTRILNPFTVLTLQNEQQQKSLRIVLSDLPFTKKSQTGQKYAKFVRARKVINILKPLIKYLSYQTPDLTTTIIDIFGPLLTPSGFTYLLTCVDHFSRFYHQPKAHLHIAHLKDG